VSSRTSPASISSVRHSILNSLNAKSSSICTTSADNWVSYENAKVSQMRSFNNYRIGPNGHPSHRIITMLVRSATHNLSYPIPLPTGFRLSQCRVNSRPNRPFSNTSSKLHILHQRIIICAAPSFEQVTLYVISRGHIQSIIPASARFPVHDWPAL
jgi:hypothetical protein